MNKYEIAMSKYKVADQIVDEPEKTNPDMQHKENYQVGYKKPPMHTRFKKGGTSPRKGKKLASAA